MLNLHENFFLSGSCPGCSEARALPRIGATLGAAFTMSNSAPYALRASAFAKLRRTGRRAGSDYTTIPPRVFAASGELVT
jgi:hypothetical protein